jgi:hypothetical protein
MSKIKPEQILRGCACEPLNSFGPLPYHCRAGLSRLHTRKPGPMAGGFHQSLNGGLYDA